VPNSGILGNDLAASFENLKSESWLLGFEEDITEQVECWRVIRILVQRIIAKPCSLFDLLRDSGLGKLSGFVILFR